MIDLRRALGLSSPAAPPDQPPAPPPPADPVALVRYAYAELLRGSLADFVRESWSVLEPATTLEWSWHLQAVCDHVQWILEGWISAQRVRMGEAREAARALANWAEVDKVDHQLRLIDLTNPADMREQKVRDAYFSLPPGSAKTRLIMEAAPAWMWTRYPAWRVICLSRNPKRAQDSARNSRLIITSKWYQQTFSPSWTLRDDQDAVSDFGNTAGGARYSKGIVAEIVGSRADALLVDDPNAPDDDEDALERVNALWDSTLYSRVNDMRTSVRIVVQQRVKPNDLTGHLVETSGKNWMAFVLPLEFDPARACETPFGWRDPRSMPGETIHPERYTPEVVAKMRDTFKRDFEAQANQNPSNDEGDGFQTEWWGWWRRADRPAGWQRPAETRQDPAVVVRVEVDGSLPFSWVDVSVDATFGSTNDKASHVGMVIMAGMRGSTKRFVVEDRGRGPRKFWQTVTDIKEAVVSAVRLTGKRTVTVLVEKKANGAAIIETLEKELRRSDPEYPVAGWEVKDGRLKIDGRPALVKLEPYEPGAGSKEARAQAAEPDIAGGDVLLPEGAPWIPAFLAEFKRFPAKPNDRVDSVAQDLDHRRSKKPGWAELFGAPREEPQAIAPVDIETRQVAHLHFWVEGKCRECGKPASG